MYFAGDNFEFESLMFPLACVLGRFYVLVEVYQEAAKPLGMGSGWWSQVTRTGPLNIIAQSVTGAWSSATWFTEL